LAVSGPLTRRVLVADHVRQGLFHAGGRANVGTVSLDANELKFAPDSSLTVTISHAKPADEIARAKWLPAPDGQFALAVRAYVPTQQVRDGAYKLPNVERDGCSCGWPQRLAYQGISAPGLSGSWLSGLTRTPRGEPFSPAGPGVDTVRKKTIMRPVIPRRARQQWQKRT
jgi:hypothetical protein